MNQIGSIRRVLAAGLSAAFLLGCAGCGSSDASSQNVSGADVPMEELDYGATLRDSKDYAIPVEYDKRYLEDGELKVLTDYYLSIQQEDAQACEDAMVDFYLQYLLDNAYGGLFDTDAYVAQQHKSFAELTTGGDDFTFAYLEVTDCVRMDETGSGVDYLKDMFDTLNGEGYSDQHLQDCKTLNVQLTVTAGTESAVSDAIVLYVVQLDDAYYVCA